MTYFCFEEPNDGMYKVDISKYVFFRNSIDRCTRSSTNKWFLMKAIFCKPGWFRKRFYNIVYIVYL